MHAGSANTDALFDKELKKYDAIKADVARNVARNEELLAAVSRDAQVRRFLHNTLALTLHTLISAATKRAESCWQQTAGTHRQFADYIDSC